MTVVVNGEAKQIEDGCTLAEFVAAQGLKPERLAVEVNGSIVRKAEWSAKRLAPGDKIEILHFVGGG